MAHIFITYGDRGYEAAKEKIISEAKATGVFSYVYAYDRSDLSRELLSSKVIDYQRGGGLWSWKPDIILSTMLKHNKGDAIVYCDAGCTIQTSTEWGRIWKTLERYDMIAQRIFQRSDRWTRREILDYFPDNGKYWHSMCQYQATIIVIIISDFTIQFVREWRNMMILHPEMVADVLEHERQSQLSCFIENRHDQALYSALIYKYLSSSMYSMKICTQWEHIEDLDVFHRQAIRATRLRYGQKESVRHKFVAVIKRILKDSLLKPLYYSPLHWWYTKHNQNNEKSKAVNLG